MNRRGFTLVELLVVAGIFAMLFGMVLNGARPSTTGQIRQAAQQIASVLLSTQSKAIGNPVGAAVILDSTGTSSISLSNADTLPFITGQCASGMPPTLPAATSTNVSITPDNADAADLVNGYKIQFLERSPAQPPTAWFSFNSGTVSLRGGNGQTLGNTIWPKPVGAGPFDVRIARYPAKAESAYDFPKGAAIDLRYSGVGDGGTFDANWSSLANDGALAIVFDGVGGVDAIMQRVLPSDGDRTVQPLDPVSPIYLLVAARADVEAGSSLSTDRSLWVVIHPQTGRVSVSSNVPQTATDAAALRSARTGARALTAIGK